MSEETKANKEPKNQEELNTADAKAAGNDNKKSNIFGALKSQFDKSQDQETYSLSEYLDACKEDPSMYDNWAARLLKAIGEPEIIDTSTCEDQQLRRIHGGKTIARYPAFKDFFGAEETIQDIVEHLQSAARGEATRKKILYLLGPVGGGKSSIGDRLKEKMEENPIYVLRSKLGEQQMSPTFESPLNVFTSSDLKAQATDAYGIPKSAMIAKNPSPWVTQRLKEANGDFDAAFEVVKVYPSQAYNRGIAKVDPSDEQNQDTSHLLGDKDVDKLGDGLPSSHPDVYEYKGALSVANQGIMEFVEMFKAPLKTLNPLLEATESQTYPTASGHFPFDGLIFAHSNESEWDRFSKDPTNEAFLDRIRIIKAPYTLSYENEAKIYQKVHNESQAKGNPIAPKTFDTLGLYSAMTRIPPDQNNPSMEDLYTRALVLNGEEPSVAKPIEAVALQKKIKQEDPRIGMHGGTVRFGIETLSATFNSRAKEGEIAADPILLIETLKIRIDKDDRLTTNEKEYRKDIASFLLEKHREYAKNIIARAETNMNDTYCQNMFDKYIAKANAYIDNTPFRDSNTGHIMSKDELDEDLKRFERAGRISNGKLFRNEVTRFVDKQEKKVGANKVKWDSHPGMAEAIEQFVRSNMGNMQELGQSDTLVSDEQQERVDKIHGKLAEQGYTAQMTKRLRALAQGGPAL